MYSIAGNGFLLFFLQDCDFVRHKHNWLTAVAKEVASSVLWYNDFTVVSKLFTHCSVHLWINVTGKGSCLLVHSSIDWFVPSIKRDSHAVAYFHSNFCNCLCDMVRYCPLVATD